MGDRCYVSVRVKKGHEEKATPILQEEGFIHDDSSSGGGWYVIEEANYGQTESLERLSKAGIMFYGDASAGDDYPAEVFASMNNKLESWPTDGHLGFAVNVNVSKAELDHQSLRALKGFLHLLRNALETVRRSWGETC